MHGWLFAGIAQLSYRAQTQSPRQGAHKSLPSEYIIVVYIQEKM